MACALFVGEVGSVRSGYILCACARNWSGGCVDFGGVVVWFGAGDRVDVVMCIVKKCSNKKKRMGWGGDHKTKTDCDVIERQKESVINGSVYV